MLGYCMALGEARREMAEIRQDVDRTLDAAAAKTQRALAAFAQKHGLDVAAPLALSRCYVIRDAGALIRRRAARPGGPPHDRNKPARPSGMPTWKTMRWCLVRLD